MATNVFNNNPDNFTATTASFTIPANYYAHASSQAIAGGTVTYGGTTVLTSYSITQYAGAGGGAFVSTDVTTTASLNSWTERWAVNKNSTNGDIIFFDRSWTFNTTAESTQWIPTGTTVAGSGSYRNSFALYSE